jgi:phosphinothricin acetyltransferase
MTANPFDMRPAEAGDFDAIQQIYGHNVLHGLASFEETPPTVEEMLRRWRAIRELGLPFIVAVDAAEDTVLGYAYAGAHRTRPAYRHSVENSVYISDAAQRRGVGRALLQRLIDDCEALGWVRQMIAVIGNSENVSSKALHSSLGFRDVGVFRSVGFKHGRWLDSVLMQRPIGSADDTLPE